MSAERWRCSASVYDEHSRRLLQCRHLGKVERDGKRYCGTHDPERAKARDAERRARWDRKAAEQKLAEEVRGAEKALILALMSYVGLLPPPVSIARRDLEYARAALAATGSSQGAPSE